MSLGERGKAKQKRKGARASSRGTSETSVCSLDQVPLLLLFCPHEPLSGLPDLVPTLLYGEMPNEVLTHGTKFSILPHAADEAVPLLVLAERKRAYTLLLDLRPAVVLSAHRVDGPPAPVSTGCPQNLRVARFSHHLSSFL